MDDGTADAGAARRLLAERASQLERALDELARAQHRVRDELGPRLERAASDPTSEGGERRRKLGRKLDSATRLAYVRAAGAFSRYVVVESAGAVFVVPSEDAPKFEHGGTSEMRLLPKALARLEAEGVAVRRELFLDVGANVGTEALTALGAGFSAVVAFEAEPENFRLLQANAALNGASARIRAFQIALSDGPGTARLAVGADTRRKSRVLAPGERGEDGSVAEVPRARLDDMLAEGSIDPASVGLLWLDVEGHEVRVLKGASRLLEAAPPLVMELNVKLLRRAEGLDELPGLLARHYTHVLDLRRREFDELATVTRVAEAIARYEPDRGTNLLLCRLPPRPARG